MSNPSDQIRTLEHRAASYTAAHIACRVAIAELEIGIPIEDIVPGLRAKLRDIYREEVQHGKK